MVAPPVTVIVVLLPLRTPEMLLLPLDCPKARITSAFAVPANTGANARAVTALVASKKRLIVVLPYA